MAEQAIIEFVIIIGFIVLLFIMPWMKTPIKSKTDPGNDKLDSIPLATFLAYDEAEEVRQFISANGFGAFIVRLPVKLQPTIGGSKSFLQLPPTDTRSNFGRTANEYVVRILEKRTGMP
jgi:hypothetical protein